MSDRITAVFINDPHTSAWEGYEEGGIIRFDYTNKRGPRRFFVMPEHCVMFADESHLPVDIPGWFVHLVDASPYDADPTIWLVKDCEIDILVAKGSQAYRMVDLDDFAQALSECRISVSDAERLLPALQRFVDVHLHNGEFPPMEVRRWLDQGFDPHPVLFTSLPDKLQALDRKK